ncbi:hypothetical protein SLE2022_030150 [Rubroshorea leprosula]
MTPQAQIAKNAVLEQCTNVQAIEWTVSGDGIVSGGIEVFFVEKEEQILGNSLVVQTGTATKSSFCYLVY